jgi:hypothetical protein
MLDESDDATTIAETAHNWVESAECSLNGSYVMLDLVEGQGQTFDGYERHVDFHSQMLRVMNGILHSLMRMCLNFMITILEN